MVTNVCFVPEEKLGITILTNNDNQSFFEALRYQILDAYLGVQYTDRSAFQYGYFLQQKKQTDRTLNEMRERVARKNQPEIKLDEFTGEYVNTVYGKITIAKSSNLLVCHFEHHPDLLGYLEFMDNNTFRITYNNIGYGVYPAKFLVANGKPTGVEIQVNEFVDPDIYLFVKDPKGLVVR
jgi:hypothetical protein